MADLARWVITFGLGTLSKGRYTEVLIPSTFDARDQEELARAAAHDLYGRAWAFDYSPEQVDDMIERWGLELRERVELSEDSRVERFGVNGGDDDEPYIRPVRAR